MCVFFWAGSLIKLVYFSTNDGDNDDDLGRSGKESVGVSDGNRSYPVLKGRLDFLKFETCKISDCLDFIQTKRLHLGGMCELTCYCYFRN